MVTHLVLMKPRPDLTPHDRAALVDAFERAVRDIPTVRGVRVGRRVLHGAGYESVAPDVGGLQVYLRHPAHDELGARFGQALSGAVVLDFEVGGIEELRAGRFF